MAHITEAVGIYSQVIAKAALIANGYIVAESETAEPFDIVAKDPINNEWAQYQVKTIRKRADRDNQLVVYATKGNGNSYSKSEAKYIIGVLGEESEVPRVFMFENRNIKEYWATEARASKRWVELPIWMNRSMYEINNEEDTA